MSTTASKTRSDIEVFRHQAEMVDNVVRRNVDGITHAESLVQPRPAGNCLNWVVGHLLWTYDYNLPMLRQEPVAGRDALKRYARGASPLRDPADAMGFDELMSAWDEAAARTEAGLTGLTAEALDRPAPFSPDEDPDETVRSLLIGILFHQAYHAGQLGVLRRIVGKDGAIR